MKPMKTAADRAAEKRGAADYERGRNEGECPFPKGSTEAASWLEGFQDAANDDDGLGVDARSFDDPAGD